MFTCGQWQPAPSIKRTMNCWLPSMDPSYPEISECPGPGHVCFTDPAPGWPSHPLTPLNPLPLSLLPPPSVTTDHPCLPIPTGYSQKQIRNPDILNPLNSANHLPGGACNNTDGAGLCTSICNQNCQPGWAATGMPRQTCVCFLLISEDWALRGMPPPLRVSTGNDIKIGGWQLCVGVVRGQDLWLSDRQVRSYADLNKEQEDRVSDSYLLRSLCSRTGATSCLSQITDCLDALVLSSPTDTRNKVKNHNGVNDRW